MADKAVSDDGAGKNAAKSLNEQNWPGLLAITALNVVVFAVIAGVDALPLENLAKAWAFLLPAGVGLAMIRVINGLIKAKNKDRLVFWKLRHPLPGSQAYTVHARYDDRFTHQQVIDKLRAELGERGERELMVDPARQNAHWYGTVYYLTQDKPSVQQASRNFLFTRDYAAISFVILIAFGLVGNSAIILAGYFADPAGDHVTKSIVIRLLYGGGLMLQYLLVRWAARNYGIEIVSNAIAVWLHEGRAVGASHQVLPVL
jgi:hypothetical protein